MKVKFHTIIFDFILEVATARVQNQVFYMAMVDETFDLFPTSVTIPLAFVAVPWELIVEFESGVFEELVSCGGRAMHASYVKIIVTLITSESLSKATHLASITYVLIYIAFIAVVL